MNKMFDLTNCICPDLAGILEGQVMFALGDKGKVVDAVAYIGYLEKEFTKSQEKLEIAVKALEFYADEAIVNDSGYETDRYAKTARQALSEINK